jgi:hypothetical protein
MFYAVGAFPSVRDDTETILPPVGFADLIVWPKSVLDNDPQGFYVEVMLDQTRVKATQVVEGDGRFYWNEEFLLYVSSHADRPLVDQPNKPHSNGTSESTISISIVRNQPGPTAQGLCIGRIDFVLGTLLVRCADNRCTFAAYAMINRASQVLYSYCSRHYISRTRGKQTDNGSIKSEAHRAG